MKEKRIEIRDSRISISAQLNDTQAAKEFYSHLPMEIVGSRDEHAYCGRAPNGLYNPLEKQTGWKTGNIHYGNGCFAILFEEDNQSQEEPDLMIIGSIEKSNISKVKQLKHKITVRKEED